LNELALFAGAGGGLLNSRLLGWNTACAVEHDPYAAAVLLARQNDGSLDPFPIWDDARTFDGRPWQGRIDVVSGGFPCQAYSTAAAGKNIADDLWPEMRRIVADVAPWYVFAENVSRRAIDRAADDLEAMGYAVRCVEVSAADMGADHIRSRCWLLAYTDDDRELLRAFNAKAPKLPSVAASLWSSEPRCIRVPDGVAGRMDRFKAVGNGQVPICAAVALQILAKG
jgi:DNA (cytosine-5)-methyltransferase 1